MKLADSITAIKGVGAKKEEYFHKLDIDTVGSLLYHYPRTYRDYPEVSETVPKDLSEPVSLMGRLIKHPVTKRGLRGRKIDVTTAYIRVGEADVTLVWFNIPYIGKSITGLETCIYYGVLKKEPNGSYKMEQPQVFSPEKYESIKRSLQPIYPLTKDLKNNAVSSAMEAAFNDLDEDQLKDFLDKAYLKDNELINLNDALYTMHFPKSMEDLLKARKRLVFNEFFFFFLQISKARRMENETENPFEFRESTLYENAKRDLPFTLTNGQEEALKDIINDLNGNIVTQRMIQADVGSGKTIICLLAMIYCLENGYKAAIMAPTEVLAVQHYKTFLKFSEMLKLTYESVLLTGKMSASEKRKARERLLEDEPCFVIGTHALIQDKVQINNLAFVVVDEQHRFGVKQRKQLSDKGISPFSIVMSATPIPRSLAMILYTDMNISIIKDVPKSRIPIKNCIIKEDKRKSAYQFIVKQINEGYQAYIICPLVDKSEKTEAQNVIEYADMLKKSLPTNIKIGLLHGRMSPDEKNEIMQDFADKKTDILVSTTVIEVGIDVPNATVIMIENATRFGLSQLHQLRGRVGRGANQSYCIFMDDSKNKEDERLKVINSSNDGFFIANEDMRLRGPGELYGLRQSGGFGFNLADIYTDSDVMLIAKEKCQDMIDAGTILPEKDRLYQVLPTWNNWYNI